ncbi:MAG: energy-coupled thiamine transporter ThiT [Clostridia bacterium]|nr:energy-coupled thiamine transporter ThiT [Clostridia bacterium]
MQHTQFSRTARARRLTESGMMVALATVISFVCSLIPVPPFNFPFGGGITIAGMLPVILVAYLYGTRWGLLTGFVYSLIQMLLGHSTVAGLFLPVDEGGMQLWAALLICFIDYILAYTVLGLGGIFRKKMTAGKALVLGCVVALAARYLCHIVSGAIFYGAWAEWFFTLDGIYNWIGRAVLETFHGGSLALLYSVVYNGCYMIPEMIITPLVAVLVLRIPVLHKRTLA